MSNEDYKAIADRLVKKQLLRQLDPQRWPGLYHVEGRADDPLTAGVACHDWRVAGACMERMCEGGSIPFLGRHTTDTYQCTYRKGWGHNTDLFHSVNESLPLAIILAYLESSESENNCSDFEDRGL